jgi:hypothetical protein
VDESVARSPSVSDLVPIDRAAALAAAARVRAEQARWAVYLTVRELELAADAVEALPIKSIETAALAQRFRGVARNAPGAASTSSRGGRR